MVAAGDPLQGQARPGQACWPPSRVAGSAATTAASSSPEATMPLKADLAPLALTPLVRALVHHKLGALVRDKVVHEHEGWRLVTCIWLHAGVVRLLANMLNLMLVGLRLEQQFKFVRVGIIYLVSGFGGSVM
ncbi:unnamed protein product [Triticum turgidum subsp. durum]|uniref:RHOMBOID-like protein n=1 Tax=Triticum turgidum subsp. durum TaxID=4567 RepID=A0A9R1QBA8_TRITD|nr:unnamed protein product [Triticum turgidum subsp. durum]